MAYTDSPIVLGPELATVEVETAAATIKDYELPFDYQIEEFGVVIVEDFAAHATDPVIKLQRLDKAGGTVTDIISLTLGGSNTNLKKGDGVKPGQTVITADTDLDNGQIVLCKRSALPAQVKTDTILRIAVTTAAGEAGGAIVPFVFIRPSLDPRSANVWTDVS